jgi:hypothetical protein
VTASFRSSDSVERADNVGNSNVDTRRVDELFDDTEFGCEPPIRTRTLHMLADEAQPLWPARVGEAGEDRAHALQH